jgi:hypothetical protein
MDPHTTSKTLQQDLTAPQQQPPTLQIVTKSTVNNSTPRRRQFRVRRGRRLLRSKSSSVDLSNNANSSSTAQHEDEDEDIFLKFNCKLSDMIAEGKAALTSKVDVTDVEIMLAEEKEREERIMRELGIQTPINRRARRLTSSSSTSSEYDYYNSVLGSGSHSNQSSSSLCDNGNGFGFGGGLNCYSPTGYSVDNGFSTNRSVIGRTSPIQYGSPSPIGGYSNGYYGSPSAGSPTTNGYELPNGSFGRYGSSSIYNNRY